MSGFPAPHDLSPSDDALRQRLGSLAASVPHAPDRVAQVTMRARRRRHHQVAVRSGAAVACAAAVVGGLLFVRSVQPSSDGAVGAATATTATTATTEAPSAAVDCPDLPVPLPGVAAEASTKVRDAADAGDAGTVTQLKTIGTVTAVDDASLTVSADPPLPDGTTSITAAITDATAFYDNGTMLAERPALAIGDRVVVGVETLDGGEPTLEFVSLHADDPRLVKVADDEVVKAADGSVSIHVGGGTGVDIDVDGTTVAGGANGEGSLAVKVGDGKVTCVAGGGVSVQVGPDGVVVETKG